MPPSVDHRSRGPPGQKGARGKRPSLPTLGHVLREHRHGLVVDTRVTQATGTAERVAALAMAEAIPGQQRVTLGADKNDETRDFVHERRELRVTPHVAPPTIGSVERDRWPDDAPSGRCRESAETAMRGRDLWLDEHDWAAAEDPASQYGAEQWD